MCIHLPLPPSHPWKHFSRPGHRWHLLWELSSALQHPCPLPPGCDCTTSVDRRCLQTLPNVAPGGEQKDPRLRTLALVYKCPMCYVCFYFKPTIVGVSRFSSHMNSKDIQRKVPVLSFPFWRVEFLSGIVFRAAGRTCFSISWTQVCWQQLVLFYLKKVFI